MFSLELFILFSLVERSHAAHWKTPWDSFLYELLSVSQKNIVLHVL